MEAHGDVRCARAPAESGVLGLRGEFPILPLPSSFFPPKSGRQEGTGRHGESERKEETPLKEEPEGKNQGPGDIVLGPQDILGEP